MINNMEQHKESAINTQKILVTVSVVLFLMKLIAWYITSSISILTDALESTVNVIAGFIGLYSLILSSKPKDKEHPYGHGKVEFISSAFEGILISIAGLIIIYEAINNLKHPHEIQKLDLGLILVSVSGIVNYVVGLYCIKKGKNENSPVLIGGGKHLITDTYSTLGIILGIVFMLLTGYFWIDSLAAIIFAFIILFTGYKIIRKSISGMMDEADDEIITEVKNVLNDHREKVWIDVHNMRIINYSGFYHIDCHLTIPFYYTINQGHQISEDLSMILIKHFKGRAEFFIHIDACMSYQCRLCQIESCKERKNEFIETITWTNENLITNNKHQIK